MKLTALRLFNVRRFAGRGVAIEGIGDGVNVLCAANEHGKSTCFDALHALFFQPYSGTPKAVQQLRPYSGGNPLVEADIETADARLRLTKQFYGGRRASVTDLATGRLIAQADEAERIIAGLVHGSVGGPAGLLWVRQGITGFEKRALSEEESEKRAREGVLTSVQGEVEALTGGRRMAEVMSVCEEELARHVTATGRPKAGSAYAAALEARDRLTAAAGLLAADVAELREALDQRRMRRVRLAELERPEETEARRKAFDAAETAFATAKAHGEALGRAEADARLLRNRHDNARAALVTFRGWLSRAAVLRERRAQALLLRDQAQARRQDLDREALMAQGAVEQAEAAQRLAQEQFQRLERAQKAREAAERLATLRQQVTQAEALTVAIDAGEAELRVIGVPADVIATLDRLEIEIAVQRAAEAAKSPSIRVDYHPGTEGSVTIDGASLTGGETRALAGATRVALAGIGTLTVSPGERPSPEGLAANEAKRRKLLEKAGVASLAEARERAALETLRRAESDQARRHLAVLAPEGIGALREAVARLVRADRTDIDAEGDPAEARLAFDAADRRLAECRNADRALRPVRDEAVRVAGDAHTALLVAESELASVEASLGPEAERASREASLAEDLAALEPLLAKAESSLAALVAAAPDLESAEATLRRTRTALEAADKEAGRLRVELADLSGRIRTRSEDAIEERLHETEGLRDAATAEASRFEREVALLTRLRKTLAAAREAAREHYFEPVMRELRPLLGLLFDDANVVFDDHSLLPSTVERGGQVEEVDRLSGGMREQLAVLTRLAFARLLARDGRPAPVILDDALVYSDDDRIERMFDALHRQSRDQQIIVFSCRQRAFAKLGGNALHLAEWKPSDD